MDFVYCASTRRARLQATPQSGSWLIGRAAADRLRSWGGGAATFPPRDDACTSGGSPLGLLARVIVATAFVGIFIPTPAAAQSLGTAAAACDPYQHYECLDEALGDGIGERLLRYYELELRRSTAPAAPEAPPARRDGWPDAPTTTPPMPFTEWPYGAATSIGVTRPASVDSPLMVAIANTTLGKLLADNDFQVYGWANVGANVSTSHVRPGGNAPAAYLYTPNHVQLDQVVLYVERLPDTVQQDHADWGMRLSALYGVDYRYTTAYGFLSNQLLEKNKVDGFDFPMLYGEVYVPWIGQGALFRAGRFISIPDIEAQLAPNNYMYTHSMTYTFDNYTNTGLMGTVFLTKNWSVQAGVVAGTESTLGHLRARVANPYPNVQGTGPGDAGYNPLYPNATFKKDPGAMPSYSACIRGQSDSGRDAINVCADAINTGQYGYNNLQWLGFTAYHRFDDKWHLAFEAYELYERNVPNADNADVQTIYANDGSPFSSQFMPYNAPNLAHCGNVDLIRCRAKAVGAVAYLNYSPDALNNVSFRPEMYFDPQGQRTGTATRYYNFAIGLQHWFSPQIEVRPEIAFYHSTKGPAFNGNANAGIPANRVSETILAGDLIWHF